MMLSACPLGTQCRKKHSITSFVIIIGKDYMPVKFLANAIYSYPGDELVTQNHCIGYTHNLFYFICINCICASSIFFISH